MYRRIYIIGSVASGKTTLARTLSKQLNIKAYELDNVVYNDKNIKRSNKERDKLFFSIINKSSWIIEDVGREVFVEGLKKSDIIYYLKINKFTIYKRCLTRWLKQKIGLEQYNYKPTFKSLLQMLSWAKDYFKNESTKIKYINENSTNTKVLKRKDIKKLIEKAN